MSQTSMRRLAVQQTRLERLNDQTARVLRERNEMIVGEILRGVTYREISQATGLSVPMIGKIAAAAGLRRTMAVADAV